jgi:hypothetical protein
MAKFDHCPIREIRTEVQTRLQISAFVSRREQREESPNEFWERLESAGVLAKALALYDQILAERRAWARVPREKKHEFSLRIEREGRQAEAECLRTELLASGMSQRECQMAMVERLQPLDGRKTRAWETPDPWVAGRLFRSKEEQDRLQAMAQRNRGVRRDPAEDEAERRVLGASTRLYERQALAVARKRARALNLAEMNGARRFVGV